jgi:hypothetical protein
MLSPNLGKTHIQINVGLLSLFVQTSTWQAKQHISLTIDMGLLLMPSRSLISGKELQRKLPIRKRGALSKKIGGFLMYGGSNAS